MLQSADADHLSHTDVVSTVIAIIMKRMSAFKACRHHFGSLHCNLLLLQFFSCILSHSSTSHCLLHSQHVTPYSDAAPTSCHATYATVDLQMVVLG